MAVRFDDMVAEDMNSAYDWSDRDAISLSEKSKICFRPVNDTVPQEVASIAEVISAVIMRKLLFIISSC